MSTQKEILEQQYVDDLKALAEEKGVDLAGATKKDEIVDALVSSKKVTAQEIKDRFEDPDEEEVDEEAGETEEEETAEGRTETADEAAGESRAARHNPASPDRVTREPAAVLDTALTDPEGNARARVEGRTSDPANRVEGVSIADVPPDLSEGPKASDGGPDAYPFPPGGDVDVALVDPDGGADEYDPPLNVDDWVILDGSHELVPDRLDGHMAFIIEAPNQTAPDVHDHPNAALTPVPDAAVTVRTRDEVNATLYLPMDAFKAVGKGGRSAVLPVG